MVACTKTNAFLGVRSQMSLQNRSTLRPTVPTEKESRTFTFQPPSSHTSFMMPCFHQDWSWPFRRPCLARLPRLCRSLATKRRKYVSRTTLTLPGFPSLTQRLLWAFIFSWKKSLADKIWLCACTIRRIAPTSSRKTHRQAVVCFDHNELSSWQRHSCHFPYRCARCASCPAGNHA